MDSFQSLVPVIVLAMGLISSHFRHIHQNRPRSAAELLPLDNSMLKPAVPLSILSSPRPFVGEHFELQENALRSWLMSGIDDVIYVLGPGEDVSDVVNHYRDFGVSSLGADEVRTNFGAIVIPSMFEIGGRKARHELVMYVNSDIVLWGDIEGVVKTLMEAELPDFVAVGRRVDVRREKTGRFLPNWEDQIQELLSTSHVEPKNDCYLDFFIFRRDSAVFANLPDMLLARFTWDNMLAYLGHENGLLIDVSPVLRAVHIHHHTGSYSPLTRSPLFEAGVKLNKKLYPADDLYCINDASLHMHPCRNFKVNGRYCMD
jgi:hypothetical protein